MTLYHLPAQVEIATTGVLTEASHAVYPPISFKGDHFMCSTLIYQNYVGSESHDLFEILGDIRGVLAHFCYFAHRSTMPAHTTHTTMDHIQPTPLLHE